MNLKSPLSLIIIFIIGAAGGIFYYKAQQKQNSNAAPAYRIAIFEPASHPAMDEIVQGFTDTIKKLSTTAYTFDRYNANGNKTLLRAQAEDIIQKNYNLIMTIGADPSKTIHELTARKKISTPVVFDAVSDPVGLGIVTSLSSSGNNITGVEEVPDYADQLHKLLAIKPNTKNILLVYDPAIKAGIHEVWAQEVTTIAAPLGITIHYAKVFHTNEISAKVQPLLSNIDVVLIFTDHTTVSGVDSLITLCNKYGITLYASDLNSGDKGAALSYGVMQYDLGVDAAELAFTILEKNKKPTDIPIISPTTKHLKINTKTMEKQGLTLSAEQRENIQKNREITSV